MPTPRLTTTSLACVMALALSAGPVVAERGANLLPCCGPAAMLPGGGSCETSEGCGGDCCRTHLPEQPTLASRGSQRGGGKWSQQIRYTAWNAESFPPLHPAGERISERRPGSAWDALQGLRVRLNV